MTQVNDILKVTMCAELFSEQVCNVFFYVVKVWTGNADLSDVANNFISQVINPIRAIQSSSLEYQQVAVENVTDGLEFVEVSYVQTGSVGGTPALPSYVAATFKLGRTTKITRNGSKRFAGITEADVIDNNTNFLTSQTDPIEAALAADLDVVVSSVSEGTLGPVIVGRDVLGHLDLARINAVSFGLLSQNISSQVSRKAGQGV